MEDLALVRLAQILEWMPRHERDVVLSAYLGRFRSPGEYARRELAGWIEGTGWRLAAHVNFESLAAAWISGGRIVVIDDPGHGEVPAGVFVLRGPW